MSAERAPLRDSADGLMPKELALTGSQVVCGYREEIERSASEFASSYDDRQDLVAEVCLALLSYGGTIRYPAQFVRAVARNLAINRCAYGSRAREVAESELIKPGMCEPATPLVDYVRSKTQEERDPAYCVEARETLSRLEKVLTPAESRCYELLKIGFEQEDLPRLMAISKQGVSKLMHCIRRKFLIIERDQA